MKRVVRWSFISIGVLFLILLITCPNEEDYRHWLLKEHHISCEYSGLGITCMKGNEMIDWESKHVKHYGIYLKSEDNYRSSHEVYKIKTLGILGRFIDFS